MNALSATPGTPAGKLGPLRCFDRRDSINRSAICRPRFDISELAFFGQDSWRATQRLTINYGLRYEKQFNPSAEANNTPVINAIKAATFPLLGNRSWIRRIFRTASINGVRDSGLHMICSGDGKTVIRAYSGIYYARTPAIVLAAPFNNFRTPAGDLSVQLGPAAFNSTTFNQAAFDAATPQYVAIVGAGYGAEYGYRQIAILGP